MSGPAYFTESPLHGASPILDGVQLNGIPVPVSKVPSGGAHLLEHMSGEITVQVPYRASTDPAGLDRYEFTFPLQADSEGVWWTVELVRKRRRPVYFVSFDMEEEAFDVGVSLTAFRLPRPLASSVLAHPDLADYVTRAWIDDVAQAVIASGTPGSGEVLVGGGADGRTVTTPTLTAGQVLRVRYLPAYLVMVAELPQSLAGFNALSRQVTLIETRGQLV